MRRHPSRALWALAVLTAVWSQARAEVRPAGIFGSHMVLQRDIPLPVWGWDDAGQAVTVTLGEAKATVTAGADGRWTATLPARPAGGPLTLTIAGSSTVTLDDVLVGEVWLCSGQSNMEWSVGGVDNAQAEIAAGDHPRIRHIKIPNRPAPEPQDDARSDWRVCTPETVAGFTAAGYFMARQLEAELDVPVGLINSSWGGTLIEPWTTPDGFASQPSLRPIYDRVVLTQPSSDTHQARLGQYLTDLTGWLDRARQALADHTRIDPSPAFPQELRPLTDVAENGHQQPTVLYNAMIHPLVPFAIRGAIWYQGESNHRDGMLYRDKMEALIGGWRKAWGEGDFPFYFVQIAPYDYGGEPSNYIPEFWEAQTAAATTIPNTGMIVVTDIGNIQDIHPKNKQDVGRRLALLALHRTYGRAVEDSGPTYRSFAVAGNTLTVAFDHADGLRSRDGAPLNWFEIIGPGADWTEAQAAIQGDTIVLTAPGVDNPTAVRFAWHRNAEPNLQNGAGLPANAFRAGEVPVVDYLALKVPEAAGYTLVYDLDLHKLGATVTYDADHRTRVTGKFDRIGYFLELQRDREPLQWVWVSMDAFTDDLGKIGVPTAAVGVTLQQNVTGLNVLSNVTGIVTGDGLTGGNIEFWPSNYGPPNAAGVPNANAGVFDFGDQPSAPFDGYGCMQVHNHDAGQTIFAVNQWKSGDGADLGIGNSTGETRDWTFSGNAGQYPVRRLRVLVREVR